MSIGLQGVLIDIDGMTNWACAIKVRGRIINTKNPFTQNLDCLFEQIDPADHDHDEEQCGLAATILIDHMLSQIVSVDDHEWITDNLSRYEKVLIVSYYRGNYRRVRGDKNWMQDILAFSLLKTTTPHDESAPSSAVNLPDPSNPPVGLTRGGHQPGVARATT